MTEAKVPYAVNYWMPNNTTKLLAEDRKCLTYRPSLTKVTGHPLASILLSQILYWSNIMKRPFYKFKEPCDHELYKDGESWTEELGFSRWQFDTALKKIGTKVTKGSSKAEILAGNKPEHIVVYWTDSSRLTWYSVNTVLFEKFYKDVLDEI